MGASRRPTEAGCGPVFTGEAKPRASDVMPQERSGSPKTMGSEASALLDTQEWAIGDLPRPVRSVTRTSARCHSGWSRSPLLRPGSSHLR